MTLAERYEQFKAEWINQPNNYDGAYGNQCKDLYSQYNRDVAGNPNYIYGDAWSLFDSSPSSHYEKKEYVKGLLPPKGAIVVWKRSAIPYLPYGHVSIFDNGSGSGFYALGQNWPKGSVVHIQFHNWSAVRGFLIPKSFPVHEDAPAPTPDTNFIVRVDKAQAAVRSLPQTSAPLVGSRILKRGDTFRVQEVVSGEVISGLGSWYKSTKGNYVWAGSINRI